MKPTEDHAKGSHSYRRLLLMVVLSFAAMYGLMYGMVNTLSNVYVNLNQLYMAGLMTIPMVLFELAVMRSMYRNRKRNLAILAICLAALGGFWVLLRQQAGIGDRQFLRSMIPHHAGALLMCGKAPLSDPGVRDLCRRILASQQAEIAEMKAKLQELGRR